MTRCEIEDKKKIVPEMGNRVFPEDNVSSLAINALIKPSNPSAKCPLVCFEDLESWVNKITFHSKSNIFK